jgi:hypothetical protein
VHVKVNTEKNIKGSSLRKMRIVWLSSLVFGRDTVTSQAEIVR